MSIYESSIPVVAVVGLISVMGFMLFGGAAAIRLREIDPRRARSLGLLGDNGKERDHSTKFIWFIIKRQYLTYSDPNLRRAGALAFLPAIGLCVLCTVGIAFFAYVLLLR